MNNAHKKNAPYPERLHEHISEKHCDLVSAEYGTRSAGGGQNQPLGSIPRFLNSERPNSLSQLLVLVFSSMASSSNCFRSSAGMRIGSIGDLPLPLGCLSRLIDMHMPIGLLLIQIGIYTNMCESIKTTPQTVRAVPGRLTTTVNASNEAAMLEHTTHPQGRQSYTWRFLALSAIGRRVIHIIATTEREARELSPAGCVMVFAGRLPVQEVRHA